MTFFCLRLYLFALTVVPEPERSATYNIFFENLPLSSFNLYHYLDSDIIY